MTEIKLGTHAAKMELDILRFFVKTGKETVTFTEIDICFTKDEKGEPLTNSENWNHVTDWRLVSAIDDLVRYGLLSTKDNKLSYYTLTKLGKKFVENIDTEGSK